MVVQAYAQQTYGPSLQKMLAAFPEAVEKNNGWWVNADNPRFDFREKEDGSIFIHSWVPGRTQEEILALGGLNPGDIYSKGYHKTKLRDKLDLLELAHSKRISWKFLESLGVSDGYKYRTKTGTMTCVMIPYYLADSTQHTKFRVRTALSGDFKHYWETSTPGEVIPYGLQKLDMARNAGYLFIGEGETDAWACWAHNIPYLGVPGATMQKSLHGYDFNDIPRIYILHEPDQMKALLRNGKGFYKNVHNVLREEGYTGEIFCIDFKKSTGCKDPSELHIGLWDKLQIEQFDTIMNQAREQAIPAHDTTEQDEELTSVDTAIEQKDINALFRYVRTLAELSLTEYLPYEAKIKTSFGKKLNMTSWGAALAEQRKIIAAAQAASTEKPSEYVKTDIGMAYTGKNGDLIAISNFSAEIVSDITTDDGAEQTRSYELDTCLKGRSRRFEVQAKDFSKSAWVDEKIGARATITTGQSMWSHFVNAVKSCSEPDERFYYAHTGWRKVDGEMVYLHADGFVSQVSQVGENTKEDLTHTDGNSELALEAGSEEENEAISQVSQVSQVNKQVKVKLTGTLSHYCLPDVENDLKASIQSSLRILDLAPDYLTMPLYSSLWRSVLGEVDYGLHLAGQTGYGKTELVALMQQHFGAAMGAHRLPGSWESTENSLEMLLFQAKDALCVVDDFKPKGGKVDQDRLHAKADRVFRQLGNGAARGRLDKNLEQRAERRPRCLLISTGEDVPRGESLKARAVVLTMAERLITPGTAHKLGECQREARQGVYAGVMTAYLSWLAPQIETIQGQLSDQVVAERENLNIEGHSRSGTNTANMVIGMKYFLQFACESGAITEEEAHLYLTRCITALRNIAKEAASENTHDKPSELWRRHIVSAITGANAHLVTPSGDNPGLEYGWIKSIRPVTHDGIADSDETFHGGGTKIGWIDGEDIYLLPALAYKAARAIGSSTGEDITTLETTLRKFLVQDKMLASTSLDKTRKTITVRRRLENLQRDVLHLKVDTLFLGDSQDMCDSVDSHDSEGTESACEVPSEVSQVVSQVPSESCEELTQSPLLDSEGGESSSGVGPEVNQVPDYSESATFSNAVTGPTTDIKRLLADFKKKYGSKQQVFWTAPRTNTANGYLSPEKWYGRFVQCYNNEDVRVREAAIEALKEKIQA